MNEHIKRLDKIEGRTHKRVESVTTVLEEILSGKRKVEPNPLLDSIFIGVEKEREKMKEQQFATKPIFGL